MFNKNITAETFRADVKLTDEERQRIVDSQVAAYEAQRRAAKNAEKTWTIVRVAAYISAGCSLVLTGISVYSFFKK